MQFARRKPGSSAFEIVITSLLDVNFLLIMFFMMTAHFQRETHAPLELPQESGEEQARVDESGLVINITDAGELIVKSQPVTLAELRPMVREEVDRLPSGAPEHLKLMVRVDRHASTEHLNSVMSMLREQGVGVIRIATEVPVQ